MTKTLTEQWREGKLKSGNYYTVCYEGWSGETFPCNLYYSERLGFDANVKEVLAPVPSYDEYKRLQEQLSEANKALKEVCMHAETEQFECRCGWVEPCKDCNAHYSARDYLEKWGAK